MSSSSSSRSKEMESFAIQCTLIGGDFNAEAKDSTMTVDLKNKKFAGMTLKDMAKKLKAPIQESGEENRKAQPLISSTSFNQKGVEGPSFTLKKGKLAKGSVFGKPRQMNSQK